MLNVAAVDRVYLARGSTDLRKSIDGLAILVKEEFDLDPFSSSLFVFCNRQRDKLKILHRDHNGFWLLSLIMDNSHYPDIFVIPKSISKVFLWLYFINKTSE
jgi:transposase